jgi:hypothetical protein
MSPPTMNTTGRSTQKSQRWGKAPTLRIRSSDAGDREYITDTLTKHVRKIASILGSTEERVLISVNKYKARFASL